MLPLDRPIPHAGGENISARLDILQALDDDPQPDKRYNVTKATQDVSAEELFSKSLTDATGRKQLMLCVLKSGLMQLALNGRKSVCKRFREWVRRDVLMELDTRGTYSLPGTTQERLTEGVKVLVDCIVDIATEAASKRAY